MDEAKEVKKVAQESKKQEKDDALAAEFLAAVDGWRPDSLCTKTNLSNFLGWHRPKFDRIYVRLFEREVIELSELSVPGPKNSTHTSKVVRRK